MNQALIGREQELALLTSLLQRESVRLITLTGPVGTGKTRLALYLADNLGLETTDGVALVMAAGLSAPNLLSGAICHALEIEDNEQTLQEHLQQVLGERSLLLVLDALVSNPANAEFLEGLLDETAALKILVTSLDALHIQQEHVFPVHPLSAPTSSALASMDRLTQYSAVQFFTECVRGGNPSYAITTENGPAVVSICSYLEGLPLALELAAARSRTEPTQEVWASLQAYLTFQSPGSRDAAARRRTLEATLRWTCDRLSSTARQALPVLALFPGGWTTEAAAHLCQVDSVSAIEAVAAELTSAGLVEAHDSRLRLREAIREFALEELMGRAALRSLVGRLITFYLTLVERLEPEINGSKSAEVLAELDAEYINIRTALQWALSQDQLQAGLRMGAALWRYWLLRGYASEGRWWLELALAQAQNADTAVRARALNGAGTLTSVQGDFERARELFTASLTLQRELGNQQGEGFLLNNLGLVALELGDHQLAQERFEASLQIWETLQDSRQQALTLGNLGLLFGERGDYAAAETTLQAALKLWQELNNPWGQAVALVNLGEVAANQDDHERALPWLRDGLERAREIGDVRLAATALCALGSVYLEQGDVQAARAVLMSLLAAREDQGDQRGQIRALIAFAALLTIEGAPGDALRLISAATAQRTARRLPATAPEQMREERLKATLRDRLSPTAWDKAWQSGWGLRPSQAFAAARAAFTDSPLQREF